MVLGTSYGGAAIHQPRKFHALARPPGGDATQFSALPVELSLDLSDNNLTVAKLGDLFRHLPIKHIARLAVGKNDLDASALGYI